MSTTARSGSFKCSASQFVSVSIGTCREVADTVAALMGSMPQATKRRKVKPPDGVVVDPEQIEVDVARNRSVSLAVEQGTAVHPNRRLEPCVLASSRRRSS